MAPLHRIRLQPCVSSIIFQFLACWRLKLRRIKLLILCIENLEDDLTFLIMILWMEAGL